ncbi:unnamed protein product [Amoebophrya sp. A25]|nr:unnamed protein product [Amoebophrya sp. A25]|eukprot:GSA25T00002286001.1
MRLAEMSLRTKMSNPLRRLPKWSSWLLVLAGSCFAFETAPEDYLCRGYRPWMNLQKQLITALSGRARVDQVAHSFSHLLETRDPNECILGHLSLRLLLQLGREEQYEQDTAILNGVGWHQVMRSGWPVFRLLRFLEVAQMDDGVPGTDGKSEDEEQEVELNSLSEMKISKDEDPCSVRESDPSGSYYREFLHHYVVKQRQYFGDGIVPETAAYLAQPEKQNPCTLAAAFVAFAWSRIPIYNHESESLIRRAQAVLEDVGTIRGLVRNKQHPLLTLLDETASTFQAFLIDGGYFYYDENANDEDNGQEGKKDHEAKEGNGVADGQALPRREKSTGSSDNDEPKVDYTLHMMPIRSMSSSSSFEKLRSCVVPFATRSSAIGKADEPLCDPYAAIVPDLARWRQLGVSQASVHAAMNQITDAKHVLFRYVKEEAKLYQVLPVFSHLNQSTGKADADLDAVEPTCLARKILSVLEKSPSIGSFDLVLNHGDMPLLRKKEGVPPFYNLMDQEARSAVPLFSIASNREFHDILFPNVCRPQLVNLTEVVLEKARWKRKKKMEGGALESRVDNEQDNQVVDGNTKGDDLIFGDKHDTSLLPEWESKIPIAFWRGTDRGAVNWSREYREMLDRGSPRRNFLEMAAESPDLFDTAFLDDDLANVTVVNSDANFVPLDEQAKWKYALDLPGNGYSGGLKQKLTGTSPVLLATDMGRGIPVYEHYHMGLTGYEHVLPVTLDNAAEQVRFAREHDEEMQQMVASANGYMQNYEKFSACYIWRLLERYSSYFRYNIIGPGTVSASSVPSAEDFLRTKFPGAHYREYTLRRTGEVRIVSSSSSDEENQSEEREGEAHRSAFERDCIFDLKKYA